MPLTVYNDTVLHEAGHTMIAYLAQSILEIDFVTVENHLSKTQDYRSAGGLKARLKINPDSLNFKEHDVMVLICLAGLAVDDINHSGGRLTTDLYEYTAFLQRINSFKYKGDFLLLIPHLEQLQPALKMSQRDYIGHCQEFLYDFFTTHWAVLVGLRNELVKTPDYTLQDSQIKSFLDNSPLRKWMNEEWNTVIESRASNFTKMNT